MPAKSKKINKKANGSSPWLSSFGAENDLPDSLLEVLKDHDIITCEEIVVGLSERDITDLKLSVGHRVLLRRAIAALASDEPAAASGNTTLEQDKSVPTTVPLNMAQELATIEAVFGADVDKDLHEVGVSKVASSPSEESAAGGKQLLPCELIYGSDGKQLKPLQLTSLCCLTTLLSSSLNEAQQYPNVPEIPRRERHPFSDSRNSCF